MDHVAAAKAVLFKAFADTSTIEVRTMMKIMPGVVMSFVEVASSFIDMPIASPKCDGEALEYIFVTNTEASMEVIRVGGITSTIEQFGVVSGKVRVGSKNNGDEQYIRESAASEPFTVQTPR